VDASGPIFVVLALACLFYLVPRQRNWRMPREEDLPRETPVYLSMKTVHAGSPIEQDSDDAAVSTIQMRRAGRRAALRLAREAEKRRRSVFLALVAIALATVPFAVVGWMVRWWVPLAAFGVVVAWAVFSNIEARRTQKQLDAIVLEKELGDEEKTIIVQLAPRIEPTIDGPAAIVGPNGDVQMSLWEPITVVPSTYISAPTAARTVRTIDLSAPAPIPVTEDQRDNRSDDAIAV
jgi:hypothetical protein